jgi:uncharacterized protein YlaI
MKKRKYKKNRINGKICEKCGIRIGKPYTIGHINHKSKFLELKYEVIQWLCEECEDYIRLEKETRTK